MFEAKIVLDSLCPTGKRLSTLCLTYPRIIHSEILTHRDRARNSASSRAIPFPVMIERIVENPFVPIEWGMEKKGMQMGEQLPPHLAALAEEIWLKARDSAVMWAKALHNIGATYLDGLYESGGSDRLGGLHNICQDGPADPNDRSIKVHKSLANRITEPWMWITVVMTATEWDNFFRLRCHPDAEVHFQKIACMARDLLADNVPRPVRFDEWHLPYVTGVDREELEAQGYGIEDLKRISTARCARVSYLTHEGKRDPQLDMDLFQRLANGSGWGHYSPYEMVAQACRDPHFRSGPYLGWKQFRKEFPLECA